MAAAREDFLVSLDGRDVRSLFGLEPGGDSADGIQLDVTLARLPRRRYALRDERFVRELYRREDELFSWLAAHPEHGKTFLTDFRTSFQTATRDSGEFLQQWKSIEQEEPDRNDLVPATPPHAAARGFRTWTTVLPSGDPVCIVNTDHDVYVGSKGWIYKLRATDGTVQMRRSVGKNEVRLAISRHGDKLFVGSQGCVRRIDPSNFSTVWRTEIDRRGTLVNLLLDGDALYAGSRGTVVLLDTDYGRIRGENNLKWRRAREVRMALADDGRQLFVGTDGYVMGLGAKDLETRWQTRLFRARGAPVTVLTRGDRVYAASNGRLFKLTFNGTVDVRCALKRGNRDVQMQFSPDGRSLLVGTGGHAFSFRARDLEKRWATDLLQERGTAVSVLARGDVLYAGNCGQLLHLNIATGAVTFRQSLPGGRKEDVAMALSADGAHLRLGCNGVVTQTPAAGDLSAGWQAVAAARLSRVNATLGVLFYSQLIPREIRVSLKVGELDVIAAAHIHGTPQISGGGAGKATFRVSLIGGLISIESKKGPMPVATFGGDVELTVDLESIQARIQEDHSDHVVIAIDLASLPLFDAIDLRHLHHKLLPTELILLDIYLLLHRGVQTILTEAVSHLDSPFLVTLQKPLPVSLKGDVVRFTYTSVPGNDVENDFLSMLFAPPDDLGSFDLAPSIFGHQANTDTAFIFGNRLVMETIKDHLTAALDTDGFVVGNSYPADVSNTFDVRFRPAPDVRLRIAREDVQIFLDHKLEANVNVLYRSFATLWIWHALHFESSTSFASSNGNVEVTFHGKVRVPWTFFLDVFTPILLFPMIALRELIPRLFDEKRHALIFVPEFDVTDVSLPAYVQITGKPNHDKRPVTRPRW